jgi:CRP-like cAMP-binding protein
MEYFKNNKQLIDFLRSKALIHSDFTKVVLQKNQYVITEYEKAQYLFFVANGLLSVEVIKKHSSYISAFIFENDFFGLDAFSSFPTKNHAIKILSSSAIIYRIEKSFLLDSLNQKPELYNLLLTNFADVFQRHYLFQDFLSLSPIERTKKCLIYLSDFIGEINEQEQVQIPTEITQEVLARFCRTSQSRISLCLKELQEAEFLLNKKAPFVLK